MLQVTKYHLDVAMYVVCWSPSIFGVQAVTKVCLYFISIILYCKNQIWLTSFFFRFLLQS